MKITKVDILEYRKMVKFADKAFHIRFRKKLSWLYDDNPNICQHHHSVRDENGDFIGLIASIPMSIINGDDCLLMRGIGTVSTSKKYRGQGVMKNMLLHIAEVAKDENVDIMVLGGSRQRYQRYGYVPIGMHMKYLVTSGNLKAHKDYANYSLISVKDNRYDEEFKSLSDMQYQHIDRPVCNYLDRLNAWNNKCCAVMNDGKIVGQICYKHNTIFEILTAPNVDMMSVLKVFSLKMRKLPIIVYAYGHQQLLLNVLDNISHDIKAEKCAQIKIVNPRNLVRVLLTTHLERTNIGNFSASIHIEGIDTFTCTIQDNKLSISDSTGGECDYTYTLEEFSLAVFGVSHAIRAPFRLGYLLGIPNIDKV